MRRKTIGRTALVLGSALLALGIAEVLLRARIAADDAPDGGDEEWRARYRRMNETLYRRSEDAELVYEPVPSSRVEMEYGTAAFNAAGMRDDREHAPGGAGARRVVLLGDSLVWSEFVGIEDSLGRRTEEALGDGWEVLNFGVTGYDTSQEARWYERAARPFAADVVALVWCMNDLMIMSGPFERFANERDRARKDAQEVWVAREAPVRRETLDAVLADRERDAYSKVLARAFGLFTRWRLEGAYVDEHLVAFARSESRARARRALARIARAIRASGARPLLVISPVLESWDRYHWAPIHELVRDAGEQAGFTVLDPLSRWRAEHGAEELRMGTDNLHYGRRGHRILGGAIAGAARELAHE